MPNAAAVFALAMAKSALNLGAPSMRQKPMRTPVSSTTAILMGVPPSVANRMIFVAVSLSRLNVLAFCQWSSQSWLDDRSRLTYLGPCRYMLVVRYAPSSHHGSRGRNVDDR